MTEPTRPPDARLSVVLVEPDIHWNTGNSGRTCVATDAKLHLVRPLGFSIDDRAVRRAGLDYWAAVDPVIWSGWAEFEQQMFGLGTPFFFTPDAAHAHWEVEYPAHSVLLFGSESRGFDPAILERYSDHLVRLPMNRDAVRSLNLSTCVGVGAYEVLRQWASGSRAPSSEGAATAD